MRPAAPSGPHEAEVVLDDEQRRVVDHPGGPLPVLAGPGTGKTTTLVEAIARRFPSVVRRAERLMAEAVR